MASDILKIPLLLWRKHFQNGVSKSSFLPNLMKTLQNGEDTSALFEGKAAFFFFVAEMDIFDILLSTFHSWESAAFFLKEKLHTKQCVGLASTWHAWTMFRSEHICSNSAFAFAGFVAKTSAIISSLKGSLPSTSTHGWGVRPSHDAVDLVRIGGSVGSAVIGQFSHQRRFRFRFRFRFKFLGVDIQQIFRIRQWIKCLDVAHFKLQKQKTPI